MTITILLFFIRLFYPNASLFITPDFGQSDLFQLNYPAKFSLYQALHGKTLPLWNRLIGTGFPQLAEGQIGTFNLVNLVLYTFLPFVAAINTGYFIIFLTAACGTFFYLKFLKHNELTAFFGAVSFSLSGMFITHISHINLIQASSFLPWIFLCAHLYVNEKKPVYLLALALLLSQQLFAGFPQITFITLCGIFSLFVYEFLMKELKLKNFIAIFASLLLCIFLSAVQVFPSQEFLSVSTRKGGFQQSQATQYSFPWGHFVGFVLPDFFGTPKDGSYPPFTQFRGSVYWENTGYIGLIPLALVFFSLFLWKKSKHVRYYWFLLAGSALLMTGKYSPLYLIYSFFPFNYFRVPSRFILLFVWALVILSAYGFQYLQKHLSSFIKNSLLLHIFLMSIILIASLQLWDSGYTYNPLGKAETWLKEPALSAAISSDERYYSIGTGLLWNTYFTHQGWKDTKPYLVLNNFLRPNLNLIYGKQSFQVYPILVSTRYDIVGALLEHNITLNDTTETFTISDTGRKLLAMHNIGKLISHYGNDEFKIAATVFLGDQNIRLYEFPNALPRARFVYKYEVVDTVESLTKRLSDKNFYPEKTALLEKAPEKFVQSDKKAGPKRTDNILWLDDANTHIRLKTKTTQEAFLILADLYYPGWIARVDGKEQEIFAAYASQRAMIVPSGNHVVEFEYKPESFRKGLRISAIAHFFTVVAMLAAIFYAKRRKLSSRH